MTTIPSPRLSAENDTELDVRDPDTIFVDLGDGVTMSMRELLGEDEDDDE